MPTSKDDDIRAVMIETAKVQVAAMNAGIEFWSGWVECAGKFAQAANKELLALSTGDGNADEVVSRITDSSRKYLTSITELPDRAVARFREDLKTDARTNGPRRRAAAAKD
jgi:hypothetical protein